MASQDFDATGAPQDIVAALSLADGMSYAGQNLSTTATLFIREAAAAPAAGARAFKVEAGSPFNIKPSAAPIWLWTDDAGGCPVIVGEAP